MGVDGALSIELRTTGELCSKSVSASYVDGFVEVVSWRPCYGRSLLTLWVSIIAFLDP